MAIKKFLDNAGKMLLQKLFEPIVPNSEVKIADDRSPVLSYLLS